MYLRMVGIFYLVKNYSRTTRGFASGGVNYTTDSVGLIGSRISLKTTVALSFITNKLNLEWNPYPPHRELIPILTDARQPYAAVPA